MSAKLTLLYEVDYPESPNLPATRKRYAVIDEFPSYDVTITDFLAAYETLLRAAGFHCPHESLDIVVDESHN